MGVEEAALLRANIELMREKYPQATAAVTAAIKIDPRRAEAYSLRARIALDNREFKPALRDVSRALRLDKRLAEAFCVRGSVYAETNKTSSAVRDFRTCLNNANDREMREWASYELTALGATAY